MTRSSRTSYRVAVVGGGIVGLYTAYHLLRAGVKPVLVADRGFLSNGASGRNGGGVRQQWETAATIRLAREAVAAYRRFAADFGYTIWFRQDGYLFLAETKDELERLALVHRVVRGEGLPALLLDKDGVAEHVPDLDLSRIVGGTFLSTDGTLYPFPALWGVYEAVGRLGGEVLLHAPVEAILRERGRVKGLVVAGEQVTADAVVNAAGGWSASVSALAGLTSPNVATRHEILATEALKPFLGPMVIRLRDGLYFSQTMRGEIVGGLTVSNPKGTDAGMPSSARFLGSMARALLELLPGLHGLNVLRAWSGFYDETPDGLPVIGEDPRLPGFFHANGFGGHGFMLAPATTRRVAKTVLGEKSDLDPAVFGPGRFLDPGRPTPHEGLQPG